MKYFIAKYRVSQDALDVLFGALKKAEHEGIEFLGCDEDTTIPARVPRPRRIMRSRSLESSNGKNHNKNGKWSVANDYYQEVVASMAPGKSYVLSTFADQLPLKNKFKNKGQEMQYTSKHQLISQLVKNGKLGFEDGKIKLLELTV